MNSKLHFTSRVILFINFVIAVFSSEADALDTTVIAAIGGSVGGLGLITLCGLTTTIILCCKRRKSNQKRDTEHAKEQSLKLDDDKLNVCDRTSSLQDNKCYGSRNTAEFTINIHTTGPPTDDEDDAYDDTIIPAHLPKANSKDFPNISTKPVQKVAISLPDDDNGDYDDIIVLSVAKQQRNRAETISFETMLNPAYASSQDCHSICSVSRLSGIDESNKNEGNSQTENSNGEFFHATDRYSDDLSDYEAYVNNNEYLIEDSKEVTVATSTRPLAEDWPLLFQQQRQQQHQKATSNSVEMVHEYDYPNVATDFHEAQIDASMQGDSEVVVHAYNYTNNSFVENLNPVSLGPDTQGDQSSSPVPHLASQNDRGDVVLEKKNERKQSPNILYVETADPQDHIYENATSTYDPIKVQIKIKDSSDSHETAKTNDYTESDDESDYTFDKLGNCVYLDPQELLQNNSEKVQASVEDVHYTRLSPVTFWEGEWSQRDLLKANAVYADVKKVVKTSKKPECALVTLDAKLGTLV